mgnify:CR=1 FL=1
MEISSVSGNAAALAQQISAPQSSPPRTATATPVAATGDTPGVTPTSQAQPTLDQVQQALEQVQQVVRPLAQSLQFSIDKDTHGTVVKIVDTDTNKVIRQIPSEEMLQMAKALDKFTGLLMKQQV